jgi:hypothetical protein
MKGSTFLALVVAALASLTFAQDKQIEKWDFFELPLPGPTAGHPFVGIEFSAVFQNGDRRLEPQGFYDGGGTFKIRCMPDREGTWTHRTKSNYTALDGKEGRFTCTPAKRGSTT